MTKIIVFTDGWCPMCQRYGAIIQRLDWRKKIDVRDLRKDTLPMGMSKESATRRIACVDENGSVHYGFDTLIVISIYLPLGWFVLPLLLLLQYTGKGDYWYDKISDNRLIFPHCSSGKCHQGVK